MDLFNKKTVASIIAPLMTIGDELLALQERNDTTLEVKAQQVRDIENDMCVIEDENAKAITIMANLEKLLS